MRILSRVLSLSPLLIGVGCTDNASTARPDSPAATASSQPAAALPAGGAYLPVDGGRIWYKVSGVGTATPAILLHGGPGFGSYYMKPLEALADERRVVRYDQLGA